ncbi:hypothetical protein RGQ29_016333 [Quercus rubra]|uniref:Uncharacterized protein n=1 Tax=Quercus rubra TaxID=3512 RepID=A0AAN7FJY0_QUERU|nr:hypothetical protein RGQ29_016333 [Quercus rubra]
MVSIVTAIWLSAMVCSQLMRACAYEEEIAPSPAMDDGSAFAFSASIVAVGCSLLCYVVSVCMH